ncbi:MAG: hypothetical protein WC323_00590 [Patescibacteria group bacterium]|jgi:hypothetical protein
MFLKFLNNYKERVGQILSKPLGGIIVGVFMILTIFTVLAFTEPLAAPSITEPETAASTGNIETLLGTSTSATTGVTSVFDYLRQIYTNIGQTPASTPGFETDAGRIKDLVGDSSPSTADGKTIFRYLKAINDNLDFPDAANVRDSDTVKGAAGSIADCASPGSQSCYATGSYYAGTACASEGSQSCYATGSYYAGTTKTINNATVSQSAGYYAAFNLTTAESDLTAGNIVTGISIFGVAGTATCQIDADSDSANLYSISVFDCNESNVNVKNATDGTCDGDSDNFLDYTARAANLGNWLGYDLDDASADATANKSGTMIYNTDVNHDGLFGGRSGIDSFCVTYKPASLACNNIHAFASNNATDQIVNMPAVYGYQSNRPLYWVSRTGLYLTKFANNWADALDNSIMVNARDAGAAGYPYDYNNGFWTGSLYGGVIYNYGGSFACSGWSTNNGAYPNFTYIGTGTNVDDQWLIGLGLTACNRGVNVWCACNP